MFILHRVSENKGWTHTYMLKERKRVINRYFNYIHQDAEDEKKAMEEAQDKRKEEEEMLKRRQEREEWLRSEGKI